MTVKELKDELAFYEDDDEVIFEIDDDIPCESWTEDKYGYKQVHVDSDLKVTFIGNIHGDMRIELGVEHD